MSVFEGTRLMLTDHALKRFRERIDPTATPEQIEGYCRQSTAIGKEAWLKRYGLRGLLAIARSAHFRYGNVVFVVSRDVKGFAIDGTVAIVTVFKSGGKKK